MPKLPKHSNSPDRKIARRLKVIFNLRKVVESLLEKVSQ